MICKEVGGFWVVGDVGTFLCVFLAFIFELKNIFCYYLYIKKVINPLFQKEIKNLIYFTPTGV